MATPKHLTNAPITEAIIDICIQSPAAEFPGCLDAIAEQIADQYPIKQIRHEGKLHLQLPDAPDGAVESKKESWFNGYLLKSEDEHFVVHIMKNRFAFSQLKPYEDWGVLRTEARRLWDIYRNAVAPESVTRVATRFINRIDLPFPFRDFEDFLTSSPSQPPELPQALGSFSTRSAFPDPATDFVAIVNQVFTGIENLENKGGVSEEKLCAPVILDIDTFKTVNFPADSNDIWDILDQLRDFKNRIFFSNVTDLALEPYV